MSIRRIQNTKQEYNQMKRKKEEDKETKKVQTFESNENQKRQHFDLI